MAYIITRPCVGVCDTACVAVCPVDCIAGPPGAIVAPGSDPDEPRRLDVQLYIDPDICIDCGACEPECPVEAIFEEDELPDEHADSARENAAFFADR